MRILTAFDRALPVLFAYVSESSFARHSLIPLYYSVFFFRKQSPRAHKIVQHRSDRSCCHGKRVLVHECETLRHAYSLLIDRLIFGSGSSDDGAIQGWDSGEAIYNQALSQRESSRRSESLQFWSQVLFECRSRPDLEYSRVLTKSQCRSKLQHQHLRGIQHGFSHNQSATACAAEQYIGVYWMITSLNQQHRCHVHTLCSNSLVCSPV